MSTWRICVQQHSSRCLFALLTQALVDCFPLRPLFPPKHWFVKLAWCLQKPFFDDKWQRVIFSDECGLWARVIKSDLLRVLSTNISYIRRLWLHREVTTLTSKLFSLKATLDCDWKRYNDSFQKQNTFKLLVITELLLIYNIFIGIQVFSTYITIFTIFQLLVFFVF